MTAAEGSPAARCRLLRARGAYGPSPAAAWDGAGPAGWAEGGATLEAYWCLATQEPVGPDDRVVHASLCRPGRPCFSAGPAGARAGGGGAGDGGTGDGGTGDGDGGPAETPG